MTSAFQCVNRARRERLRNQNAPVLNGIDYLEVDPANQRKLAVHFLFELPRIGAVSPVPNGALAPTAANVRIEGGTRIRPIAVRGVTVDGNVLKVETDIAGDFSTYTLRIVGGPSADDPPAGFDPQLCEIAFSFKATCPSDFDCVDASSCPPQALASPAIDYLAKDYASFRRLMLDRISTLVPGWSERNPADLGVTLVELCAYAADHLSYAQDAVGTELYLGTARRRVSVRRHARLLDYAMHDGCNARAYVAFEVKAGGAAPFLATLQAGLPLIADRGGGSAIADTGDHAAAVAAGVPVFETRHEVVLSSAHNEIRFHTWSDSACCLPKGATRATLAEKWQGDLTLREGDLVLFEEVLSPTTGLAQDANPANRCVVRLSRPPRRRRDELENVSVVEIEWAGADALPFSLCISANNEKGDLVSDVSVARGNVVLADHGTWRALVGDSLRLRAHVDTIAASKGNASFSRVLAWDHAIRLNPELVPPEVDDKVPRYRPRVPDNDVTRTTSYDHARAAREPARGLLEQDPRSAVAAVVCADKNAAGETTWNAQRDMLGTHASDQVFVTELESDGSSTLRFGDGVLGKRPDPGHKFRADYRIGNGTAGNVGAESIARLVLPEPKNADSFAALRTGVLSLRNPLGARGGVDAEPIEAVRQYAPQAFRQQRRAVTEDDYARAAEEYEGVQRAAARLRWTGSWYTMFVTVDRVGGVRSSGDREFLDGLRAHLETRRIAGYDLEINDPVPVPLDIRMLVCAQPRYFNATVRRALLDVFSSGIGMDGTKGFFHPDHLTFGQPLPLSRVVAAAMAVPGVLSVEVKKFQRFARAPNGELEAGTIEAGQFEVLRLDNDANFPENGKIDFDVLGGL